MSTIADPQIYDLIGVGAGPFNLGLAALLEPVKELKARFFEARDAFNWHEGLLIDDCHLQVPFMADLVTMADPTSPYSYLNYLHRQGRLLQFYFYEHFQIPRIEYNRYCRWVSEQLASLRFSTQVTAVEAHEHDGQRLYRVTVRDSRDGAESRHLARHVVLGVGTVPHWPAAAQGQHGQPDCVHSSDYLRVKETLQRRRRITVVGGGQSAAEVFLDLLRDQPRHGYALNWLARSTGFFPMEYSKLGLEHFSPDYIEHFHSLPAAKRKAILARQGHWYKGISFSTIGEIYDCLYQRSIDAPNQAMLQACSQLEHIRRDGHGLRLEFQHMELHERFTVETDALVLATGYQYVFPACLEPLRAQLQFEADGQLAITRGYTVKGQLPGHIFVQNGEMHTHGIAAPDLGLGGYRSAVIINQLLGREHYPAGTKTVFQNFGIAEPWRNGAGLKRAA